MTPQTLRDAIHEALYHDAALVALIGGPKVYDEAPDVDMPYVVLGYVNYTLGAEYEMILHGWSRDMREAHLLGGALLQTLDDRRLALDDRRLVNLRFAVADVRRDRGAWHVIVRLRLVLEECEQEAARAAAQ